MRIELTRAILKYQHPFSDVFIFGKLTCKLIYVSLHWLLDRDKLEHVSLIRLVTGIVTKPWLWGNMRNWWSYLLFPRKCENRGIRVARFNLILISYHEIYQLTLILRWGPLWYNHKKRFSVHCRFIEKSMYSIYIMYCLLRRAH